MEQAKTIAFGTGKKPVPYDNDKITAMLTGGLDTKESHGDAICHRRNGSIHRLENVRLPDGSRSSEVFRGEPETGLWRYMTPQKTWTYGNLKINEKDIFFAPQGHQPQPTPYPVGTLPYQLITSPEARAAARDDVHADSIYGALCGTKWQMIGTGRDYVGTRVRAAEIVSVLRRRSEPYNLFLLSGSESMTVDAPIVEEIFHALGWEFAGNNGDPEKMHARALSILTDCESRPDRMMPDWYLDNSHALRVDDDNAVCRLSRAAFFGRVSYREWTTFWENFVPELEFGYDD